MGYSFFIARKLSLSSDGRKNSPAVIIAIISVAISLAVMTASIAIVMGFKKEITDKVVGFNGHITLYTVPVNQDDDNLITLTPSLQEELKAIPFVKDFSLQAAIPAVMKTAGDFKGIYLKGLNGNLTTEFINGNLEDGEIPDFSNEENRDKIIISRMAASQLGLKVGDKIETYFFSDDVRVRRLTVSGIYNSHFDQYDEVMMYGALGLVQQLGSIDSGQGTYLQIATDNLENINEKTLILQERLNEATADGRLFRLYRTDNVLNQGAGFFNWLSLLDTNVVVILILMMTVGCVTLISGMLIIIMERKKFIGLMKSLGARTGKIRNVFILVALKIALLGLIIGNVIILTFLYFQATEHFLPLDGDSYYIDFVPVSLDWQTVLLLNAGVLFVIYLVLILPSRFVAGISPSETMRYE